MKIHTRLTASVCAAILASTALAAQQALQYPVAKKGEQVDVYHGTRVADPYRWMEDDMSKDTAAWVEAENKVTFPYLEAIPYRAQLQARVKQLNDYPKYGSPFRKGPYYFFTKNDGLQDQSVLYIQKGLDGPPEVLIDPNKWGGGGATRLAGVAPAGGGEEGGGGGSEKGARRGPDKGVAAGRRGWRDSRRRRMRSTPCTGSRKAAPTGRSTR